MNRLDLARRLRQEALQDGPRDLPVTTLNQTGDLGMFVSLVDQAWKDIQNLHQDWRWKRRQCQQTTGTNVNTFTPASFTDVISAVPISNFRSWVTDLYTWTCYTQSIGQGDESWIWPMFRYDDWRILYDFGNNAVTQGRPTRYAIAPNNDFKIGPKTVVPYVLRGWYRESVVEFAADADVPGMPLQFHMLIVWKALMMRGLPNAQSELVAYGEAQYTQLLNEMELDQTPRIGKAGPIA